MRDWYLQQDAVGIAGAIKTGEVRAVEVFDTAVGLAEQANESLNAITVWDLERARAALDHLPDGPLTGVPFLLKDLYTPMEGLPSTDGTRLYPPAMPLYDSELVRRFKAAGLVIFGRSAAPEFGLVSTTETQRHGATANPWSHEHSAGGSSGGAAAMVAARVLPVAHASDGGGSIRIPASNCGVFGLKPTRASVSAGPDFGEGWSGMSSAGVVSRSVRDSAAVLDAICGNAPGDPYAAPAVRRPFLEEVAVEPEPLRIGMVTTPFTEVPVEAACIAGLQGAALLLDGLGHAVDEHEPALGDDPWEVARPLVGVHTLRLLEDVGALRGSRVHQSEVEAMTWRIASEGALVTAPEFARGIDRMHLMGRRLADSFAEFDLLMTPTTAIPPVPLGAMSMDRADDEAEGLLRQTVAFTLVANLTGVPAMSMPLHWSSDGLPVGVQFMAPMGREDVLFRLAGQLERARPWEDRHP
jgi:amidase